MTCFGRDASNRRGCATMHSRYELNWASDCVSIAFDRDRMRIATEAVVAQKSCDLPLLKRNSETSHQRPQCDGSDSLRTLCGIDTKANVAIVSHFMRSPLSKREQ